MKRVKSYGQHEDIVLRTHIELSRSLSKISAKEISWLAKQELTISQFGVLESLYHLGSLSIGKLTKLILSTPGNITVVVKNLHSKGFIDVYPSDEDKRIKILKITPVGSGIIESIFPEHVQNLTSWYDKALNEEELQMLAILLRKLEKAQ